MIPEAIKINDWLVIVVTAFAGISGHCVGWQRFPHGQMRYREHGTIINEIIIAPIMKPKSRSAQNSRTINEFGSSNTSLTGYCEHCISAFSITTALPAPEPGPRRKCSTLADYHKSFQ